MNSILLQKFGSINFLFCFVKQDLFAVSCLIPLLTHRARELGASPSVVGVIGKPINVCKLKLVYKAELIFIITRPTQIRIHAPVWVFYLWPTSFVIYLNVKVQHWLYLHKL